MHSQAQSALGRRRRGAGRLHLRRRDARRLPSPPPHQFFGSESNGSGVLIDGQPAPDGTLIEARNANGVLVGSDVITGGDWGIQIDMSQTTQVTFFVEGVSTPTAWPVSGGDLTEVSLSVGAGGAVLSLLPGGQFVFWNFGPYIAADVFATVKIAWLFDPDAFAWTSFIPLLGTVNFTLIDGAVLWIVSNTAQDIRIGGGAAPELNYSALDPTGPARLGEVEDYFLSIA